jgi:hypothetical protein
LKLVVDQNGISNSAEEDATEGEGDEDPVAVSFAELSAVVLRCN